MNYACLPVSSIDKCRHSTEKQISPFNLTSRLATAERSPLLTIMSPTTGRILHSLPFDQLVSLPPQYEPPSASPSPTSPPYPTVPRSLPAATTEPFTSLRPPSIHQRHTPRRFSLSITFIVCRRQASQSHNAVIASQFPAKSVCIRTGTGERAAMHIRGQAMWGRDGGGGGRGWASEEECGHCEG